MTTEDFLESKDLFRMLFDNSPLGILLFDWEGVIVHCNESLAQIMGAPKEKVVGFNLLKGVQDPDFMGALQPAFNLGVGCYEGSYISVLGNKRTYLRVTFSALVADDGAFTGGIAIFEDITHRKRAEGELQKAEEYNNLILNGISEDVVLFEVVDEFHYRFAKVNNNALNSIRLKEDQLIGNLIEEVISAKPAKIWIDNCRNAIKGNKPIFFEENLGAPGVYSVKLFPIMNEDGECTHVIATASNVTEKKKMEEHQVKAQKLESVGLLAGGIAHDFNNILTAILGNTSLARRKISSLAGGEKEKILSWLDEIERASHQAKDLTQQLLIFAKGGSPILRTVAIGKLLKESTDFALRGSNVRHKFIISEVPMYVEIDEGQISQVIHNLVVNSVHAMPQGGTITVSVKNVVIGETDEVPLKNGEYVKISVMDQGHGIPVDCIDKIFDPYFSTKQMGSGLGLTTAYTVVRKHGGHIAVESEWGAGTTFYVYLPVSKKIVDDKRASTFLATGKGRVLVMDDEKIIRQVLGDMLSALGYEAVCVKDGAEAIEAYTEAMGTEKPYDIIIMDLTIPGGLGGKDTIRILVDKDPKVKAIVSSGYSNDPVMANYKQYGFLDIVVKPYNIERLGEVLETVINGHQKKISIS